jgi:two-component system sensor histidine kinase HydH
MSLSPTRGRALLPGTLLVGGLLIGMAGWNYRESEQSAALLTQAQGEALGRALEAHLAGEDQPSPRVFREGVALLSDQGLRWFAGFGADGELLFAAGRPAFPFEERPTQPGVPLYDGTRARVVLEGRPRPVRGPPPMIEVEGLPKPGEPPPRPVETDHPPMPPDGPPGAPPPLRLVVDLEPTAANRLIDNAGRLLLLSAVVAVLLVGLSAYARRAMARESAAALDLERARHLASLGQASAVLAHELRNPLAGLKGHAQLLAELLEGPLQDRALRVVREAVRMEKVCADLLNFAREAPIEREPVDPLALFQRIVEDGGPRVRLETQPLPKTWSLDSARVRQLVENLLSNSLSIDESGAEVLVRLYPEGDRLMFEVVDRGPGLPPGDPENLFEPFVTRRAKGTGLGLAVARQYARLHGGDLVARPNPAGGACFLGWLAGGA